MLRGHFWDTKKVTLLDRRPLKRVSIHMKFYMTWQEKGALLTYRWLLNRGDRMGRFGCFWKYIPKYVNICKFLPFVSDSYFVIYLRLIFTVYIYIIHTLHSVDHTFVKSIDNYWYNNKVYTFLIYTFVFPNLVSKRQK